MANRFKWGIEFKGIPYDIASGTKTKISMGAYMEDNDSLTLSPYWIHRSNTDNKIAMTVEPGIGYGWSAESYFFSNKCVEIKPVFRGNEVGLNIELTTQSGRDYVEIPGIIHTNVEQVIQSLQAGYGGYLLNSPAYYGANNNVGHIRNYSSPVAFIQQGQTIRSVDFTRDYPSAPWLYFHGMGTAWGNPSAAYIESILKYVSRGLPVQSSYATSISTHGWSGMGCGDINTYTTGQEYSEILSLRMCPNINTGGIVAITPGPYTLDTAGMLSNMPVWLNNPKSGETVPAEASNFSLLRSNIWDLKIIKNNIAYESPLFGIMTPDSESSWINCMKSAYGNGGYPIGKIYPYYMYTQSQAPYNNMPYNYMGNFFWPTANEISSMSSGNMVTLLDSGSFGIRIQSTITGNAATEPFDILIMPSIWSPWGGIDIFAAAPKNKTSARTVFRYDTLTTQTLGQVRIYGINLWQARGI